MARFDERDTIISRMELVPGSERYLSYYRNCPPGVEPERRPDRSS